MIGREDQTRPGIVNPNDLRGILNYIPWFRGETFVLCVDGAIVDHGNFANLLLDIAVLRSLNIRVALVHGAAFQIERLAGERGIAPSDLSGEGTTDQATMELALDAGMRTAHQILEGLAARDLRAALANAVRARPMGIIGGEDRQRTGRVDKIDAAHLADLLERGIVPVIPPLGFGSGGRTYRVGSGALGVAVARSLEAIKLVFVLPQEGILEGDRLVREIPFEDLARRLESERESRMLSPLGKARHAVEACRGGVPRVHLICGTAPEGLLSEIFSTRGIGTLVHANGYHRIRRAERSDLPALLSMARGPVSSEELSSRTQEELEASLGDFLVCEEDQQVVGCVALHAWSREGTGELAFLCVEPSRQGRGVGTELVRHVEERARQAGLARLFLLSTQSFAYFQERAGFRDGSPEDLPGPRRKAWEGSGRNSRILVKDLEGGSPSRSRRP